MYEYIQSCKVKDLPVCPEGSECDEINECRYTGLPELWDVWYTWDSMKRRGLPDGKDYGQQKYTGSNTSRASLSGPAKERGGYACCSPSFPQTGVSK